MAISYIAASASQQHVTCSNTCGVKIFKHFPLQSCSSCTWLHLDLLGNRDLTLQPSLFHDEPSLALHLQTEIQDEVQH